jgi:hypothetical protein
VRFREHKGNLGDSLATTVVLKDWDELVDYIAGLLEPWNFTVRPERVYAIAYGRDDRIGWDTYLITLDGYGVMGFTDGDPRQ